MQEKDVTVKIIFTVEEGYKNEYLLRLIEQAFYLYRSYYRINQFLNRMKIKSIELEG